MKVKVQIGLFVQENQKIINERYKVQIGLFVQENQKKNESQGPNWVVCPVKSEKRQNE